MIDPLRSRFWFADFYCNTYMHYVTVVVTVRFEHKCNYAVMCAAQEPETWTDKFCEELLVPLKVQDNPFFTCYIDRRGYNRYEVNLGDDTVDRLPLHVEVCL